MFKKLVYISVFVFFSLHVNGQYRPMDAYGFYLGHTFYKSDFGARNDMKTNLANNGITAGARVYLNLFPYSINYASHFKNYFEISFIYARLDHVGKWVEGPPSPGKRKLKAMHGNPLMFGMQFGTEFHLQDLRSFNFTVLKGIYRFNPYAGLFLGGYYYQPNLFSDLGDINNPAEQAIILFPKFVNKVYNNPGFTFSVGGKIGVNYQVNYYTQLFFETSTVWFSSDKVDGIDTNDGSDKFHDWSVSQHIGLLFTVF